MSVLWVVVDQEGLNNSAFFGRERADPSTITFVSQLSTINLIQELQSLVTRLDLTVMCQDSPTGAFFRARSRSINCFESKKTMNFSIKFSGKRD